MQRDVLSKLMLLCVTALLVVLVVQIARSQTAKQTKPAASKTSSACVQCHKTVTPQIVTHWSLSQHSKNEVNCSDCHGSEHKFAADVANAKIPTPETCATCHPTQVEQFKKGKHANA
ncbi:MAG: multiheme c-type cytochrome [Armatimonadota bacterium]